MYRVEGGASARGRKGGERPRRSKRKLRRAAPGRGSRALTLDASVSMGTPVNPDALFRGIMFSLFINLYGGRKNRLFCCTTHSNVSSCAVNSVDFK